MPTRRNLMAARADYDALTQNTVGEMYQGATRTPWEPYANNCGMWLDLAHPEARRGGNGAICDGTPAPRSMTTVEFAATQGARDILARIEADRIAREKIALREDREAAEEETRRQSKLHRDLLRAKARARADAKAPGRAQRREAREALYAAREAERNAKQAARDARIAASIAKEDARRAKARIRAERAKSKGTAG